jgi:hypothetical protein
MVIRLNLLMMVSTQFTILKIIFTDNTIYTKLETNLTLFFMRLDKVEEIILILVKTSQQ